MLLNLPVNLRTYTIHFVNIVWHTVVEVIIFIRKKLSISSSPTTPSTLKCRNLFLPFIRRTSDHRSRVLSSLMASAILVGHILTPSLIMCLTALWCRALVIRLISVISMMWLPADARRELHALDVQPLSTIRTFLLPPAESEFSLGEVAGIHSNAFMRILNNLII